MDYSPLLKKNKTGPHVLETIQQYIASLETKFGRTPKAIRVDNGREFINEESSKWFADKGIEVQTTAPYSPSQNGVAERFNRTIMELARAMLTARALPNYLWAEAVSYASYIRNRCKTNALNDKTPYEAWNDVKPDVSHLREFGCDVWVLDESDRSKLDPKANKFIFVGFEDGPKATRYYNPKTRRILVSRNVTFNKNEAITTPTQGIDVPIQIIEETTSGTNIPLEGELPQVENNRNIPVPKPITPSKIPQRVSTRNRPPIDYAKLNNPASRGSNNRTADDKNKEPAAEQEAAQIARAMFAGEESVWDVPANKSEADASPESAEWRAGMEAEINQLVEKGTWELVECPPDRVPIGNRWTYAKKFNSDGVLTRHKARLVGKGYTQIPGQDYTETFSPVMRMDTFRFLMSLVAAKNLECQQMDVVGAFLNGELKETIYMRQPEGFEDGTNRVCLLKRTLYGLKQSGREWNRTLDRALNQLGYTRLEADHCVYLRIDDKDKNKYDIIASWVDDLLCISTDKERKIDLRTEIENQFKVTHQGEPRLFLGIEISRDEKNGSITLSQGQYLRKIAKRFDLHMANPVATPLDPNIILTKSTLDSQFEIPHKYRAAIGSLMYASIGTRPDITFAVQHLSQFLTSPSPEHWTAVKRVFRYLNGTLDYGITYNREDLDLDNDSQLNQRAYSDADWASNVVDRHSISGNVFMSGGGAISWSSNKQKTISMSSMEAEYIAGASACQQIIWLRTLFTELGIEQTKPTVLLIDNKSAIDLAHNPEFHARAKHIDIRHHFLRYNIEDKTIEINWIPTDDNIADVFTKALSRVKHQKFVQELGMSPA